MITGSARIFFLGKTICECEVVQHDDTSSWAPPLHLTLLSFVPLYSMSMAFLTAQRSKDPNTQVGACIVDGENRIIGLGYNGFPSGCSDDHLPWSRSNKNNLDNKYLYVCHAEVNAILNKGSANVKGATVYVALFPCQNCAKMIIQAGIQEVVFLSDAYHNTPQCRASRIMFCCAGVKLRQYVPSMQSLDLDLGLGEHK
jgi:dCMP deaminase